MASLEWKREWKALAAGLAVFAVSFFLPVGRLRFDAAVIEALHLVHDYAREHVLLCLVPAFFIAGAIAVFLNKDAVMRYLGPQAPKGLAYTVASVSGGILAVCSCTVLPLFAGIYRMGAGLGPATTFLYSGPAINVLAIILTARILGLEIGIARAVGAVLFSVVIGLIMQLLFRRDETEKIALAQEESPDESVRPLSRTALYFAAMIALLIFANWGRPTSDAGVWRFIYEAKWILTSMSALALGILLSAWFRFGWRNLVLIVLAAGLTAVFLPWRPLLPFTIGVVLFAWILQRQGGELGEWLAETWGFARQILPLLFAGVLVAGLLLGRPGHEGLIPASWVERSVGGNGFGANLFASVAGAFMYFATLTEVPILQGLMGAGMGKGPALALLLAGPALSLPNMLVIASVLGAKKTLVFVLLVVVMATATGMIYGSLF